MNREEINHFIESNLTNFSVNSTGWNDLIRKLLFEFAIAGWNMENRVFGKEKFGELRCYTYFEDEILNTQLKNIKDKYSELSLKICEICGSEGKVRSIGSWQTTLCLNHFLEQHHIIEVDADQNVRLNNKTVLNIKDIRKAELEYDLQELWVSRKGYDDPEEKKYFSWRDPNYYLLLKMIPLTLFPEDRRNEISMLFQNLQYCEICGHKAVHERSCLRCHQEPWNDSGYFIEDYGEKSNYIKECQMDIFLDEDDYEKYFKHDRSFEKSTDHQILFSPDDLREYEKLLF
jgi:ribosomal protein L32